MPRNIWPGHKSRLSLRESSAWRQLPAGIWLLAASACVLPGYGSAAEPRQPAQRPAFPGAVNPGELPFALPRELEGLFQGGPLENPFGPLPPEERRKLQQIPVSAAEERKIGEQAVDAHLQALRQQGLSVVNGGREHAYVSRLVELIRPRMEHAARYARIRVYIIETNAVDARSFPGGTLFFTHGMLETAGSEAALVGVVGHELSHLDHGHQLLHVRRLKLAQQGFAPDQAGFSPDQFLSSGLTLMKMFSRPFQPEDEAEADADGVRWAYEAGYDPRALGELFRDRRQPPGAGLPMLDFFRSHPPDRERWEAVQRQYHQLQRAQPRDRLYLGRENLQRRVTRAQRAFAE